MPDERLRASDETALTCASARGYTLSAHGIVTTVREDQARVRRVALTLCGALLLAGCGHAHTRGAEHVRPRKTALSVRVASGIGRDAKDQRFALRCNPTGGDMPNRTALCKMIGEHPAAMLDPGQARSTCVGGMGVPPSSGWRGCQADAASASRRGCHATGPEAKERSPTGRLQTCPTSSPSRLSVSTATTTPSYRKHRFGGLASASAYGRFSRTGVRLVPARGERLVPHRAR